MSLLNLRKLIVNVLKFKHITFHEKQFSVSASFLCSNNHYTRLGSYKQKEKHLLEKDKIPQDYELIYKTSVESYIGWAMHVSTATASIISAAAIYQYAIGNPLLEPAGTTLVLQSEDLYYFSAAFLAINAALRFVISMFPLRIYKKPNIYLAVYHRQLPWIISHHQFKQGQVKAVNYSLSPWNNVTYKLGNRTTLLLEDCFKTPSEFHEMRDDVKYKF